MYWGLLCGLSSMIGKFFSRKIESPLTHVSRDIIRETMDMEAGEFTPMGNSFGGHVFKVGIKNSTIRNLVVKLSDITADEPPFEFIRNDDRIYGVRLSNELPAYRLFRDHTIPVPQLYASGNTQRDAARYHYAIYEYLPGESVAECLAKSPQHNLDGLHSVIGSTLGKIHNIRRRYQGWIEMKEPYSIDWGKSFFDWIGNQIDGIRQHKLLSVQAISDIESFVNGKRKTWSAPAEFVLSHMDGFQAMARQKNTGWEITGVIDIEDHQFMDQRLVLAGYELVLESAGRKTPDIFWEEYTHTTTLDGSYHDSKKLFILSILLAWMCIIHGRRKGMETHGGPALENIAMSINKILEEK
jgi:hypothetical protein